ncbi:hypothetical protein SLS58_000520 [Diplodia intermedia]|uniref:C2H2-type domain-containing protein n=1 Tax=Diplodia intermedia TaxID=856260 RepID=A0ABR3U4W4_9PEZI
MSQNGYPAYTTYEAGAAYFNGPISAPPRPFDGRAGPPPSAAKQMEPGMHAILTGERHPITYTYPGYEGSFHGTPPIDQNLQALLSGHRPYASARDTSVAYSNPIANFYHDADGPWNSVRATNQAGGAAANATLTVPVPNLDYSSYRDAPPSEISDSGYASQAAASQSVVNTNAEPPDYNREKHQLKHTKPHTCDQPDCTRKEGFATTNDLDRHKKSVHNIPGLTKSFRCAADRCKNKDKIWPRLDNFKQHVQRMHKGQNQNDLIQRSVSPIDNALAGIDSKSGNMHVANHKDSPDLVINQRRDDDGSNSLVPDVKSSLSHTYARQCQWEQGDFQQYQGDSTQPLVMSGDQQPSQISPSDAPKLRQLAVAAVTADSQPTSQATSKNGSNKVQSSKCAPAMEDGQKRLYSKFSNIIASSIANGAANESLNKAVLRALMELGQNKHIVATTSHRKGPAAKEAQTSSCVDRSPPGSPGPDGTETTMSTAEVKAALATLSRSFAKNPDVVPNGKAGKPRGFECSSCSRVSKRRCDLK